MKLIRDLGMFEYGTKGKKTRYGLYLCECGEETRAITTDVKRGKSTRCKKCSYSAASKSKTKYITCLEKKLYKRYRTIYGRCYIESAGGYDTYGACGVTICKEWLDDPMKFIAWAIDNGYREGLHIDKDILSKKLGISPPMYSPETCMFISPKENAQEATGHSITIDGVMYPSKREAERKTGIDRKKMT